MSSPYPLVDWDDDTVDWRAYWRAELEALKQGHAELEVAFKQERAKLEVAFKQKRAELEVALEAKRSALREATAQERALQAKLTILQRECEDAQNGRIASDEGYLRATRAWDEARLSAKKTHDELEAQIATLHATHKQLTREVEAVRFCHFGEKQLLEPLKTTVRDLTAQRQELERQVVQRRQELAEENGRHEKALERICSLETELVETHAQFDALGEHLKSREEKWSRFGHKIIQHNQMLENRVSGVRQEITKLQKQLAEQVSETKRFKDLWDGAFPIALGAIVILVAIIFILS